MSFVVRRYRAGEERELWNLFHSTVRTVNLRDYTPEQVCAWAPDEFDEVRWRNRIEQDKPFVCESAGQIIGFADVQPTGYIDLFFVHQDWQGRGVGKALMDALEQAAEAMALPAFSSHVSITARRFFESRGFVVQREQQVAVRGCVLTNFVMIKRLTPG